MNLNFMSFKSSLAAGVVFAALGISMIPAHNNGIPANAGSGSAIAYQDDNEIIGAGSSFENPLFSKMFADYNTRTGLKVNYQSVGSGAGISQLTSKTVDFGASDAPMNGKQDSALAAPAIHIPITAGAVVLSYNLPEVKDTLLLTPDVLAGIFLATITKWNDPKIASA